jgi:group II intron reverse transcriptase/maturase
MIIAVPTGIKIWATVRVYAKLLSLKTNSKEEFTEGHSAYFDAVMPEEQQPALKRIMRAQTDAIDYCRSKIDLKAIGGIRMRLNYQNSSNFGNDFANLWFQLLHRYLGSLKVKIYFKGFSITKTLLNSFRTGYKRVSLFFKSRVAYATGEVSWKEACVFKKKKGDGRGSVVPILYFGKGSKHFVRMVTTFQPTRSYVTRSETNSPAPVEEQPVIPKGLRVLAKHWQICNSNRFKKYYDLRGILKQESIWFAAYLKLKSINGMGHSFHLKSNPKAFKGPDENIIDSLTKTKILELRDTVLSNNFAWIGVREIMISKPGKPEKLRPLGSINDRLVQEVLRTILEPIYEFKFSQFSHGFRPNRSCHTALKWMNTNMKESKWFIEGAAQETTIDHKILMKILERNIQDLTILRLIESGLKAKVFQKGKASYIPEIGTPQVGTSIHSLLLNIYLNELDQFIVKLCEQYQGNVKPGNRKKNPKSHTTLRSGNKSLYYKSRIPSRIPNEVGYRNCKFVRYADDFVIGILGPRKMAIEIRDKVKDFLKYELNIELSLEKTKVTHITKGIEFLGYIFSKRIGFNFRYSGMPRKITFPTLDVNMKKVIARLSEANFCDRSGNPKPAFRYLRLPQSETNIKVNNILRGLSEWWSIAGNRRAALARVAYIIRYSIAKVYAAKFKMKTVATVFKIGGNDLSKPIGVKAKSVMNRVKTSAKVVRCASKKKLTGILFDRYHKIPKPKPNKLNPKCISAKMQTKI